MTAAPTSNALTHKHTHAKRWCSVVHNISWTWFNSNGMLPVRERIYLYGGWWHCVRDCGRGHGRFFCFFHDTNETDASMWLAWVCRMRHRIACIRIKYTNIEAHCPDIVCWPTATWTSFPRFLQFSHRLFIHIIFFVFPRIVRSANAIVMHSSVSKTTTNRQQQKSPIIAVACYFSFVDDALAAGWPVECISLLRTVTFSHIFCIGQQSIIIIIICYVQGFSIRHISPYTQPINI